MISLCLKQLRWHCIASALLNEQQYYLFFKFLALQLFPFLFCRYCSAMGRGRSNDVTGDELVNALRTLTGLELDTMFEDGGKVDKILPAIERAFRVVDSGGLFKLSAMEDAFKVFDKNHKNKF